MFMRSNAEQTVDRQHVVTTPSRHVPNSEVNPELCRVLTVTDIFSAPDLQRAMRVSIQIRSDGRAQSSKIWPALDWVEFRSMVQRLEQGAGGD